MWRIISLFNFCDRAASPTSNTVGVNQNQDDVETSMAVDAEQETSRWRRRRIYNPFRPGGVSGPRSRAYSLDGHQNYDNDVIAARHLRRNTTAANKMQEKIQRINAVVEDDDITDHKGTDHHATDHRSRRKRDENDNSTAVRSLINNDLQLSKITCNSCNLANTVVNLPFTNMNENTCVREDDYVR